MNESGMEYGGEYDSRESKQHSPIDQLAKLQSACPQQLSCVASEVNEQGETEYSHIVQADGVYLSCPAGVYPPFAQFAVWAANNTPAIVGERDGLLERAELAEQLCRARGDMERATEAEYEKLLAERDAEIALLQREIGRLHFELGDAP